MEIIWWKTAQYRKIGQKIHFFIKFLCSPILMELDQDIWQIIFELVIFYEITIGKALALSSFVLEGGSGVWITLYVTFFDNILKYVPKV